MVLFSVLPGGKGVTFVSIALPVPSAEFSVLEIGRVGEDMPS